MKIPIFFFSFLFFSFIGCAMDEQEANAGKAVEAALVNSPPPSVFLTRKEVLDELQAVRDRKSLVDAPLTEEEQVRASHLIPDQDFLKDVPQEKALVPRGEVKDLPPEADLRFRDTPIKSQDDGKCTAFAGTAAIENTLQREKIIPGLDLSEWHSWSFYRQYSANAFIKALTKNRVGDEVDYPQYGKPLKTLQGHTMISKQKYLDDDVPSVLLALSKGHVVYLAMETPKDMLKCPKVISPNSSPAHGGHALLISGYYQDQKGSPLAILKNSWGKDCGDHGYQYLPLEICHKKGFYCSFWEIEEVDHLASIPPHPHDGKDLPEKVVCKRRWYAPWVKDCHPAT